MLLQKPQMFNVLESCRQGWYPLPSEKGTAPKISAEEAIRIMKLVLPIDEEIRKEMRPIKDAAMLSTD